MSEQDEAPESLGRRFRTARVSKGMTIAQMASITRIQEDALRALEEDRFDRLPPLVFTKGSVRSYARALNLDEDHCVRLFSEHSGSFYHTSQDQPLVFPTMQVERSHKRKAMGYVVAILLGVILLLVILRIASPPASTLSNPTTDQPGSESLGHDGAVSASDPVGAHDIPETQTDPRNTSDASETVTPISLPMSLPDAVGGERASPLRVVGADEAPLVLELEASEAAWVAVRSDDGEHREVLLRKGERVEWRAYDQFLLTLGSAGAVDVRLNGERQGPFGDIGVVVRNIALP